MIINKRKLVFKGKLLTLFKQKTLLPNGYRANLEIVVHRGAALIVPFLTKTRAIILKQYRPVIRRYIYEFPAGTLESKESALSCARREMIEETGYDTQKLTRIGEIFPVPGYSTEKIVIYKAERLRKTAASIQKDEVIRSVIITKKKLKELLKSGKIVDAKTIAALALCGWLK